MSSVGAVGRRLSRGDDSADAADPYADVRAHTKRLRAALGSRIAGSQPYPDWAGLPEGLLLQMFEIITLVPGGREVERARRRRAGGEKRFARQAAFRAPRSPRASRRSFIGARGTQRHHLLLPPACPRAL